ncbi:hypothetical protein AGABI2DRAFT_210873 [Agaricus bisporus var. bisporus H97]|uniref:hypothetical protein n=1 Tax=Agaricus bisporus var. bisporus (strain H97 / ATCC MYA-4626 / FGSC 10389) TaxID=936046 RepID=UPI00029F50C9|nr:hypothetical protein AGABI2DRAFT_210873 [Agaricus bisporus var. bisporus H97]EKV43116.1 hypothetical protein AGABI2DRAFT_210873 [Agaricus bisporus var. bisporus H97]
MWAARRASQRCGSVFVRRLNVLSASNTKPFYVTTPIFYPNAEPHIGHLQTLLIGDIYARYNRLARPWNPVHFLAGTDEHGLKIQQAAAAAGKEPGAFCEELSKRFQELAEAASIQSTSFVRTSSPKHRKVVEHVWNELTAKGLIRKTTYAGWYSVTDECFYTKKQVVHAPTPENPEARHAIATNSAVEWHEEENYVFRLREFSEKLLEHYNEHPNSIYPAQYHLDVVQYLKAVIDGAQGEGLDELSISRSIDRLSWGIPVPGDPSQTIYVWFDALLVYLSGVGYPDFEGAPKDLLPWPPNMQIIGKDILRFHAIYLPSILLALDLPLPHHILAHAHWTVDQKKMSKSVGNVADPMKTIDDYGVDKVRWYLARAGRSRTDVDWSQNELEKHSNEIQSLLGNYVLRVTSKKLFKSLDGTQEMSIKQIYQHYKKQDDSKSKSLVDLIDTQRTTPARVKHGIENLEIAEAVRALVLLLREGNKTLTELAPWKKNTPPELLYANYVTGLETLRIAGICLQPFIPSTAEKLLDMLGLERERGRTWRAVERVGGTDACERVKKDIMDIHGVPLFQSKKPLPATVAKPV